MASKKYLRHLLFIISLQNIDNLHPWQTNFRLLYPFFPSFHVGFGVPSFVFLGACIYQYYYYYYYYY